MAYLVLEDGTKYEGRAFGRPGAVVGEVVFNTGMTGYQEVLTDPSYCGQIVMMTYPLIGNYGVNWEDPESMRPQVKGFVVRELCQKPSNWYSERTLNEYLYQFGIMGIEGIDTRSITRKIRDHGTMRGYICNNDPCEALNAEMIRYRIVDPVRDVTCGETFEMPGPGLRVAVMDFGLKASILKSLRKRGCHLFVHRADDSAEAILANKPDGVMLTNGPGDPRDNYNQTIIEQIRKLIGKVPIFGICLGHQLMGLSCGSDIRKLRYGHRGTNHPVKDLAMDRVFITSQNHGYSIVEDTLKPGMVVSHRNWNDGDIEGVRYTEHPTFTVQFHPEASPGPRDTAYLFDRFMAMMKGNRSAG